MAIKSNGKPKTVQGSSLYEVLQGIDFEKRELIGKRPGAGLFDLVEDGKTGKLRCYACTLCERTCPTDCIEIDYCPEHAELPFDVATAKTTAAAAQPEIDMALFDAVVRRMRDGSGLIEAFHTTQETYGWLPRRALEEIADELSLPFSRVYGVANFYAQFHLEPVGKHVIRVCSGTACHVAGGALIAEAFTRELDIPVGGTTSDMLFSLETVNCLGACAAGPAARIGGNETYGHLTPITARKLIRTLRKREEV
jgi:NADH-quinone oxidoreductase subunit E